MIAPERDDLFVEDRELRSTLDVSPEDRKPFEKCWRSRFSRVTCFHAVVQQGHAVNRENECRRRTPSTLSEPCDCSALIVVVGENHVGRASRELRALPLPHASNHGCRSLPINTSLSVV